MTYMVARRRPVAQPTPQSIPRRRLAPAAKPAPRACTYCGHTYVYPCDGEGSTCMNKRFTDDLRVREGAR